MNDTDAYIGFSLMPGIGPLRFKLLKDYFGSALVAWNVSLQQLRELGLGEKLTQSFDSFRQAFEVKKYSQEWARKEISIITQIDSEYPRLLLEIADPPIALYCKGKLPHVAGPWLGVVGTRKPTTYGREITEKIALELAQQGIVIVSGLARGIDAIAHRMAIIAKTPTIAVLGCGVDIVYPPEHKELYAEIIKTGGAIISEVPPGHTVARGLFPARNRIISGLSLGVIVTEGAEDSGSLITARLALEQGREVFAIPGPITSYLSAGPTKLIKQGAKVVTGVDDILEEFKLTKKQFKNLNNGNSYKGATPQQQTIIDLIAAGTLHFDDIVRNSKLPAAEVGSLLTILELNGVLKNLGEGKYTLD